LWLPLELPSPGVMPAASAVASEVATLPILTVIIQAALGRRAAESP
jgi:hypothetical protein